MQNNSFFFWLIKPFLFLSFSSPSSSSWLLELAGSFNNNNNNLPIYIARIYMC